MELAKVAGVSGRSFTQSSRNWLAAFPSSVWKVVSRAVAVVRVAGGKGTDVDQIVRFEHDDFGQQHAGFVTVHGEEIELCAFRQQAAERGEFFRTNDRKRFVARIGFVVDVDEVCVPACDDDAHPLALFTLVGGCRERAPLSGQVTEQARRDGRGQQAACRLAQSLQVVSIIFCRERKRAALLSLATVDTEHFDGLGRDVLPTAQEVQAGEERSDVW